MTPSSARPLRGLLALWVVLACAFSLARGAVAQDAAPAPSPTNDDEAAIRQQYDDFDRLLVERDLDGVTALMALDVVFESGGKKHKLVAWRRAFDSQVRSLVSCKTRIDGMRVQGKTADVKTWCVQRYNNLQMEGTDHKKFIIRTAAMDRWVKTPEGWRLKSSKQQETDVEPVE